MSERNGILAKRRISQNRDYPLPEANSGCHRLDRLAVGTPSRHFCLRASTRRDLRKGYGVPSGCSFDEIGKMPLALRRRPLDRKAEIQKFR